MSYLDIVTNVISDFIFVFIIAFLVWGLNRAVYGRLGRAGQFFGLRQAPVKIYVSGFNHPSVKTQRVVTTLEYDAAVIVRRALQWLSNGGFAYSLTDFLAGLIGQEPTFPEPEIEVSPLGEVREAPYQGSIILIGGPVSNQLSKFYLQGSPKFKFDEGKYQKRDGDTYLAIEPSYDVAVIEKRIFEEQVVFLVHGYGEEQTHRAARYLVNHWQELYKKYNDQEFGILV